MRSLGGTIRAGLLLLALILPACRSCASKPPGDVQQQPGLGTVMVKAPGLVTLGHEELRVDEARLAAKVEAQLRESGLFSAPKPGAPTANVSLDLVGFVEGSAEALELGVRIRLRIAVRPESADRERYAEEVAAVGQAPVGASVASESGSLLQRLAERTAADLLGAYIRRHKLWRSAEREVGVALASDDNELRVDALHVVGERKLSKLGGAVFPLLTHEDESVRDAALGAVVALGDRGAIKALAQSRHMRDAREMRKILDAIGSLGGQEAEEYLSFVTETHDDEEIRNMAKVALERLHRRVAPARPNPDPERTTR